MLQAHPDNHRPTSEGLSICRDTREDLNPRETSKEAVKAGVVCTQAWLPLPARHPHLVNSEPLLLPLLGGGGGGGARAIVSVLCPQQQVRQRALINSGSQVLK